MPAGVALWASVSAALAGCGATPRPGFLARVQQNCSAGDRGACDLLGALWSSPEADPAPSAPGGRRRPARPRTQAQRDADAVLRGMERARAEPRAPPDLPGTVPDDGRL